MGSSANAKAGEIDNMIQDEMVDINRFKFNNVFNNPIWSTCPIVPKYHSTFGEPIDRQEETAEYELNKDSDPKKGQAQRLIGRVDKIEEHGPSKCYIVTDDYGVNVMYDATFMDMRALEQEMLKVCSFYINKVEPMQDRDLRNILPTVDRFAMAREICECEEEYQRAKLRLCFCYLDCLEHTSDLLEQQRTIQIIIDLMARRPRLNLSANHFKDSYKAEIEALGYQTSILKEFITMQMDNEFKINSELREMLEKTYRLIYDQIENAWQYYPKSDVPDELEKRRLLKEGVHSEEEVQRLAELEENKPGVFQAKSTAIDPKQFAEMLGMPFSSLLMLMKEHHERDPLVKTAIHEHVSFIKIQEGYPIFLYDTAVKQQNKVKLTSESRPVGILDFYESLTILPKLVSAMQAASQELLDVHKPDNGFMEAAMDVVTYRFILSELKVVRAEDRGETGAQSKVLDVIQDSSILGNPDMMLFLTKELVATIEDPAMTQNPLVMTKLDLETVSEFDFEAFQVQPRNKGEQEGQSDSERDIDTAERARKFLGSAEGSQQSLDELYKKGFDVSDDDEEGKEEEEAMVKKKQQLMQADKERLVHKLKGKKFRANIPSMLQIYCNSVEAQRLRHQLVNAVMQRDSLSRIYNEQMKVMSKDCKIYFKDLGFNFETFQKGGGAKWKDFVDQGPGLKNSTAKAGLAIGEFDPSLVACIDFGNMECVKGLLCPMGLEELRCVLRYEVMNLQALIIAVRTNQILLDNGMRQLAEIDLLIKGFAVANPVQEFQVNIAEATVKKLPEEKRNLTFSLQSQAGDRAFNILARKSRSKETIEKLFQKIRQSVVNNCHDKVEVILRQLRTSRMMLCHDFCDEMLGTLCLDSLKLELLHETNEMRKRAYLLPRDAMVHKLPMAKNGEHQFAAYREELKDDSYQIKFLNDETRKIQNYWAIPSFAEILTLDTQLQEFKAVNLAHIYNFELGDPQGAAEHDPDRILPEFYTNEQIGLIRKRLPKLRNMSFKESRASLPKHMRYVDFKGCFNFSKNTVVQYLKYMRHFSNLFDLEFFANKLPSKAFSLAGLEQCVLAGIPFWEESDESLLEDSDEYLNNSETNEPMYTDQPDGVDSKYRNKLAERVVERIAAEKKAKNQLFTDLESIKDKFTDWEECMVKQELYDLESTSEFLSSLVDQTYYNLALIMMNVCDTNGAEGTATKEIQQVQDVLRSMTHQVDQKVTYTNGFHVSQAITSTQKLDLEEHSFKPDYDNFFKAAQPMIDESALNPTEFTLLSGTFLTRYTNNFTYRKSSRFLGALPSRDYHYLDCKLLNIDRSLRKYIAASLEGMDEQCKDYACTRLQTTPKQYTINPNLQREVFQEKKAFSKQQIRSRILKRALMILMSRSTIPTDKVELKTLCQEFDHRFTMKVDAKVDQIERARQNAAQQQQLKRARLEQQSNDPIKMMSAMLKQQVFTPKETKPIIQQYDQAQCEVDVYQREIQSYMILTSKGLIERETTSLAKAFEMNGKRLEILIHPMQQFASTFEQNVDKKNHLDIINKVGPIQKMLTQFKNRCLAIETLTSGQGFMISSKDLNECLIELCRSLVKNSEVEMRTRCEHLSLLVVQYENLLYTKDKQLINLEHKLKHAKEELNKIINTKVFSRGNNLIYELDIITRQHRMIKDNIFSLEKSVKDKVRLYFDKDLEQTRVLLEEQKKKFKEYQTALNSSMKLNVKNNINYIDEEMKKHVQQWKEKDSGVDGAAKKQKIPSLTDKYAHLVKSKKRGDEQYGGTTEDNELIFAEMERLKESESEARNEVLQLQVFIRNLRTMQGLKTTILKQKHDYKVDNLQQQLTSNATLWEQLAEAEKREKILKQELERSQYEIATQEKIIERLKDDIKTESREKQKLIQYRLNKSKRLDELELKAREFEVLENVNLHKLLQMMERKEKKIRTLEANEQEQAVIIDAKMKVAESKVKAAQVKAQIESQAKEEAINKVLEIRHRNQLVSTQDETMTVEFWKNKWNEQQDKLTDLREENLLLTKVVHEAAQHMNWAQDPSTVAGSETKSASNIHHVDSYQTLDRMAPQTSNLEKSVKNFKTHRDLSVPQESEDLLYRAKQNIMTNVQLPSILAGKTNPASQQFFDQHNKSNLLPIIRAKESAFLPQKFQKRNRSVDPRQQKAKEAQKHHSAFPPKNSFGLNINEQGFGGQSITKDPSVAFQNLGVYVPKDHPMLSGKNAIKKGASTGASNFATPNKHHVSRGVEINQMTNSSINSNPAMNTFQQSIADSVGRGGQRFATLDNSAGPKNVFATLTMGANASGSGQFFGQGSPAQIQGTQVIHMHDSQTSNGKGNAFLKATARSEYSLDHQQKTEVAVSDQKSALEGSATHKAIPQQQLTVNINQTQEKGGAAHLSQTITEHSGESATLKHSKKQIPQTHR